MNTQDFTNNKQSKEESERPQAIRLFENYLILD